MTIVISGPGATWPPRSQHSQLRRHLATACNSFVVRHEPLASTRVTSETAQTMVFASDGA